MKVKKVIPLLAVHLVFLFLACNNAKAAVVEGVDNTMPNIDAPDAENPYLLEIQTAWLKADGTPSPFTAVNGFKPEQKEALNIAERPETAKVMFKFKTKAKEVESVEITNTCTAEQPIRAKKQDAGSYVIEETKAIWLTCGENAVNVKITSQGKKTTTYTLKMHYDNQNPTSVKAKKIFDGVTCPAPGINENVWLIAGSSGCSMCSAPLKGAQEVCKKFIGLNIRVVALTIDERDTKDTGWLEKLNTAKAEYNAYGYKQNSFLDCLEKNDKGGYGVPQHIFFKNGKGSKPIVNGLLSTSNLEQLMLEAFTQ